MIPIIDLGVIQLPTFYLVISFTASLILLVIHKQTENYRIQDRKFIFDLLIVVMVCGFFGARIFHIFYEEFDFYAAFPLETFKFWKGGFIYYGGFIAGLISAIVFCYQNKQNFWTWTDFFSPYIGLAYALGRIGCFLQGCCYGLYCEWPWAVRHLHPTQLYMCIADIMLVLFLIRFKTWALINQKKFYSRIFKFDGSFFLFWIFGHAFNRFMIEFLRNDDRGAIILDYSISQWISLLVMLTALVTYYLKYKKLYLLVEIVE